MPRPKARYLGNGLGERFPDFSEKFLDYLYQQHSSDTKNRRKKSGNASESNQLPEDSATTFVGSLCSEASWAQSELHQYRLCVNKADLQAELKDLQRLLAKARAVFLCASEKLRRLTPELDLSLGIDATPLDCADQLSDLIERLTHADRYVEAQYRLNRPVQSQAEIARELARRVLPILERNCISTAATAVPDRDRASEAVSILKAIGVEIGLPRSTATWRDMISSIRSPRT